MHFKLIVLTIVMALCSSQVSAEITLKSGLFSGCKYSVDGVNYKKVGNSGRELYDEMSGNKEAQAYVMKYKKAKTWALITAIPGGTLIGWPLGGYVGSGGEWKDSYTVMILIGTPFAIASLIFEGSASGNLKQAVSLYNEDNKTLGIILDIKPQTTSQSMTTYFGLSFEF